MPTVAAASTLSTTTTLQYHMGQRRQRQSVVVAVVRPRLLPAVVWLWPLILLVVGVSASTTTTAAAATTPYNSVKKASTLTTTARHCKVRQSFDTVQPLLPRPFRPQPQSQQPVVSTTTTTTTLAAPLAVSTRESKVSCWTARQRLWRRRQIFTCWLTASAGFANVQASHLYGSWLNVCSGNVLRVGAVLANALVVVVVRGGHHHHENNGNNGSGGGAAAVSSISWTVPVAVLVGYTGGTALVRWTHNRMASLQQQQQEQAAKAALESSLASLASSSSSLRANPNSHNWEDDHPGTAPPRRVEPTAATLTALTPPSMPVVALRVVRTMGPWIGACLVGADVLSAVRTTTTTTKTMLVPCALLQAMAYGMIHLAASDASGGLVLFAITGHLAGATKATIDHCQQQQHSGSGLGTSDSSATRTTTPTGWYHACMVVSFLVGSIVGSLVWDHAVPAYLATTTTTTPRWMPIHSWTGLFYAALFWWYAQPLQE
jgi:hypothetical protein